MAFKRFVIAKAFDGVAPNARATCELTIGPRVHAIRLYGNDPSDGTKGYDDIIEEVKILLGNQPQRVFTPAELDAMNSRFGTEYALVDVGDTVGEVATEFELPIFLAEPWRKNQKLSELFAWPTGLYEDGTKSVQSFVVQVKLKAGAPATSKLYVEVEVDDSFVTNKAGKIQDAPIGAIVKWERKEIGGVTGTQWDVDNIEIKEVLQGICIFDSDVHTVEMYANDVLLWELTKERADRILRQHGMIPHADRFNLVFDYADPVQDALVMADQNSNPLRKFKLRLKMNNVAARTISMMIERYGRPV